MTHPTHSASKWVRLCTTDYMIYVSRPVRIHSASDENGALFTDSEDQQKLSLRHLFHVSEPPELMFCGIGDMRFACRL